MNWYDRKLRDKRWKAVREKVLSLYDNACGRCGETACNLEVHHKYYLRGKEPWDYPLEALIALCEECHDGQWPSPVVNVDVRTLPPHMAARL